MTDQISIGETALIKAQNIGIRKVEACFSNNGSARQVVERLRESEVMCARSKVNAVNDA